MDRRTFLALMAAPARSAESGMVNTVTGPVSVDQLGTTLTHEHVMVDFIGAAEVNPSRYDPKDVMAKALPRLAELKKAGCKTMVECTPAFIGRDVRLLQRVSKKSGVQIITNTGYYGAASDKFVPEHAFRETAEQLAARWIAEARQGVGRTGIRPGFIKTGVDSGPLSEIDRKLIVAATICHRETGLRIHAHTGNGAAALDILRVLESLKVDPSAYVWVHAQNEKNRAVHQQVARAGAWVSFDGVGPSGLDMYVAAITEMMGAGFIGQLLISQDSGWYRVGEKGGGKFSGYTFLFEAFLPVLSKRGVTDEQLKQLTVTNPAKLFQNSRA